MGALIDCSIRATRWQHKERSTMKITATINGVTHYRNETANWTTDASKAMECESYDEAYSVMKNIRNWDGKYRKGLVTDLNVLMTTSAIKRHCWSR